MKFSGKKRVMILLKVTKIQGFTLILKDTFFEKPQEEGEIIQPFCNANFIILSYH